MLSNKKGCDLEIYSCGSLKVHTEDLRQQSVFNTPKCSKFISNTVAQDVLET